MDIRLVIEEQPGYIDLLRCWLSRARGVPLSLSFYDSGGYKVIGSAGRALLQTIVGLSAQWWNIGMAPPGSPDAHAAEYRQMLRPVDAWFPLLTRLTISQRTAGDEPPFSFHNAPKLREIFAPSVI